MIDLVILIFLQHGLVHCYDTIALHPSATNHYLSRALPIVVFDWHDVTRYPDPDIVSYRYRMVSPNAVAGVVKHSASVYRLFSSNGAHKASILFHNNYTVFTHNPIYPCVFLTGKTIGFGICILSIQQPLFHNHLSLLPIHGLNVIKNTYSTGQSETWPVRQRCLYYRYVVPSMHTRREGRYLSLYNSRRKQFKRVNLF